MHYGAIARRWAMAIFELGKESGALAQLTRDVSAFAAIYDGSAELAGALSNPLVPEAEREAVVVEVASRLALSQLATSSLRLLLRKRRIVAIGEIALQLARLADDEGNVLRARVTSAAPVTEAYLAKLRAELERGTGKKIVIEHSVDASLLGGVITKIGDRVIDGSVKARLASFRDALART